MRSWAWGLTVIPAVVFFVGEVLLRCGVRSELISDVQLQNLWAQIARLEPPRPLYVPHPYFGYVYWPNRELLQDGFKMQSNEEGFIDESFPTEKEKGVCRVGLMGGSVAMSFGSQNTGDRIDTLMEKKLNRTQPMKGCRRYEVLNMGIASQFQYQATQIFLYYKDLLDAGIFLIGNNECFQGPILTRDEPLRYPPLNVIGQSSGELTEKANTIFETFKSSTRWVRRYPQLLRLYLVRYRVTQKYQKMVMQLESLSRSSRQNLVGVKGTLREKIKHLPESEFPFSGITETEERLLPEIFPKVMSEPLRDAASVARDRLLPLVVAYQPLPGMLGSAGVPKGVNDRLHQTCHRYLDPELTTLSGRFGFTYVDLNTPQRFQRLSGKIFTSGVHLTPAANEVVAESLVAALTQSASVLP